MMNLPACRQMLLGYLFVFLPVLSSTSYGHGNITYTYDEAGRLTGVDYGDGHAIEYRYSPGNRLLSRVIIDRTDSDGDQMADSWELAHFNSLVQNAAGDFDGDGKSNGEEFKAGTDAASRDSLFRIVEILKVVGLPTSVSWDSVPGKKYRVQYKNHLGDATWTDLGAPRLATEARLSASDLGPFVDGKRFYRVLVEE